jgi:hypothetical protein
MTNPDTVPDDDVEQPTAPAHDHGAFDPCPDSCPAHEQTQQARDAGLTILADQETTP